MSLIQSPEFFINMPKNLIPKKGDSDYDAFVSAELDKLQYGLTVNGVYIPNWLYWHLNYWQAFMPTLDLRNNEVVDEFINPQLRDNEWLIAEAMQKAKEQKVGLLIIGGRRIAKTTIVASWLGLHGTIYEGSQNVIVGNNAGDISNITLQMDKGLSKVQPFLRYPRLLNNWERIASLGWKESGQGGAAIEWSRFHIKNTQSGLATEILAGITPKSLVYDEVGKAPMKEAFLASIKAFASPYGWRCVPILTGTGGDFTKGKDAEEMFNNPERFNLLGVEIPNQQRKTALFISGIYSLDYPKNEIPLSEYLHIEKGSELDIIPIKATDVDVAKDMILKDRDKWIKANDQKELLKAIMYSPLTPEECFLSNADTNPFPVEALKQHLDFILRLEKPDYVKLYRDVSGKVSHSYDTKLKPVTEFPVTKDTVKDAPVVIYEMPEINAPDYLYIAGGDPYDKNQSSTSPSLGSIYIYKRLYDPVAGTFQNRIVASYVARPDTMKDWHEVVEMLLEFYNATIMIEYASTNFTQYMESKHKIHWMADGYNLAREITPKTSVRGDIKGLPPTKGVQNHYKNLIIEYLTEPIQIGSNEDQTPIEIMGLTRIPDPMLLTELIEYGKEGNFDRLVAFGHALIYDQYLQKIAPNVKIKTVEEPKRNEFNVKSPFIIRTKSENHSTRSPFTI